MSTRERVVERGGCLSPCTRPHPSCGARARGKAAFHRPLIGRRSAQISSERRLVALPDVAVYVGGRRAARSRKMGAVTFSHCRCRNGSPCRHALPRALWYPPGLSGRQRKNADGHKVPSALRRSQTQKYHGLEEHVRFPEPDMLLKRIVAERSAYPPLLRECSDTGQFASYGDNQQTPLHYGHRAILPRRFSVWIALLLPSTSRPSRASVRRISIVSSSTLRTLPPVSIRV